MYINDIIVGKYVKIRSVEENDAEFTLKIRQDLKKTKFLHRVDKNIDNQVRWIHSQRQKPGDYFFIIESIDGEPVGTMGIYEVQEGKGHFGRILMVGNPFLTFEAALLIIKWSYDYLNLQELHGDVQIENKPSRRLCETLGFHFGEPFYDEELDRQVQIGVAKKEEFPEFEEKLKQMIYR